MTQPEDSVLLRRVATHLDQLTSQPLPDGLQRVSVRSLEERHRRRWLPLVGGSLLVVAAAAAAVIVLAQRHPTAQLSPGGLPTPRPSVPALTFSPAPSPSALPTPSASADPTAGWTTYHSAPNRMSFKQPAAWAAFECGWCTSPPICPPADVPPAEPGGSSPGPG